MAKPLITLQLKKLVDNTAEINERVNREIDKRYRRSGAIIRGIGRRLVRRTKKNSPPGKPPRTHVTGGKIGFKSIVWVYNDATRTLNVGVTPKPGENGEVISALAFGGMTTTEIFEAFTGGTRDARGRFVRQRGRGPRRKKRVHVRKRPHMELAGETFEKRFPDLLEDLD